jgi:putative tryptophan/tyrosine transport system substrate-binding protein
MFSERRQGAGWSEPVTHMKRREFIAGLGATSVALPMQASAQQPAMPVMGFLNPTSADTFGARLRAFREGLKDSGYVEGENVAVVYRWAENQIVGCRSWRPNWSAAAL